MKEAGRGSSSSGLSWLNIGQCPLRCLSSFRSGEQEISSWPASITSPTSQNIMPASPAPTPSRALSPAKLRSEEHTSELQSLMRISYAVFCLKKKKYTTNQSPFNIYNNVQTYT